ncbi:MAG: PKD domain-containing protein [Phycisphaerae bacterium]|nr:PKD domain-containing protein [Phycisphaerae bacterium]
MRTIVAISLSLLLLGGGCPQPQQLGGSSAVTAVIGYTSSTGPAPFTFIVSAVDSTSRNGGPLLYEWDFDDGTGSTEEVVRYLYENPGFYRVILRVTDPTGAVGVASLDIHVQGGGAVAIISADPTSGSTPLTVQFDGSQSLVFDDTIRDYFWDFGDGSQSQESQPQYTYYREGEFTVTLRIVTAGGVEAGTYTTITVGERSASLQFDGSSYALLPLGGLQSQSACTFETWVKPESEGGNVVTVGVGFLTLDLLPDSNAVRLRVYGTESNGTASLPSGTWKHVALVYDAGGDVGGEGGNEAGGEDGDSDDDTEDDTAGQTGLCTVYLDGVAILTTSVSDPLVGDLITIGNGLRGKLGEVRFWSVARSADEIEATRGRRLSGSSADLLGVWPLDEGSGQTLRNLVSGGSSGTLGSSKETDGADPAWSSEGPPL